MIIYGQTTIMFKLIFSLYMTVEVESYVQKLVLLINSSKVTNIKWVFLDDKLTDENLSISGL